MSSLGARGIAAVLAARPKDCTAHRYHWPKPLTLELHHVIPQAWQRYWRPNGTADSHLWRPETVALCPTGHRNVHAWIVKLMRASDDPDPDAARRALGDPRTKEYRIACRSLYEWVEAGGNLNALRTAHLFGAA